MKKLFTILVMLVAMNASAQWVQMSNGMGNDKTVTSLAVIGNNIFAGIYQYPISYGVFLSTNNGDSWVASGLASLYIYSLAVSGTNLFAGTNNGVFLSTNSGTNWSAIGLTGKFVTSFIVSGSNIFAGTSGSGIFLTTNNGINWTAAGLPNKVIMSFAVSGMNLFAGTGGNGVFLSTNNGTSWASVNNGLTDTIVHALAVLGTNLFAGTNGGVFLSTNNGTSWTAINNGLTSQYIMSFAISGTNIIAGIYGGVFLSTNNGTNWLNKSQGFNDSSSVYSLLIANNYFFSGLNLKSVWRRPLSELIGIQNISTETPSSYSLSQNYPNPFNPSTKIRFSVVNGLASLNKERYPVKTSGNDKIVLKVYDVMGREVQTLVNESLKPGTYEVSFDGSSLTSGVYFYKLITGGFTETKKLLLLK